MAILCIKLPDHMKQINFGPCGARVLLVLVFAVSAMACGKLEDNPEGGVEIFLLDSFELTGGEYSCAIEEGAVVPAPDPLVPYSGFRYYDSSAHAFKLTGAYRDTIANHGFPVSPTAFGVYANGELVYTGYFIPAYSSVACAWVTIDPLFVESNGRLDVKLGYPGSIEGVEIPDRRNDPRILGIFKRDGNLR